MGVVKQPKTTTTPSTPTTTSAQPSFVQAASVDPAASLEATATSSRFQVSPITEERPANLAFDPKGTRYLAKYLKVGNQIYELIGHQPQPIVTMANQRPPMGHHEATTGTSSPSPAGSTYTTASESGGPNTIESEPGNYLSASDDPPNLMVANVAPTASVAVATRPMQAQAVNVGPPENAVNYAGQPAVSAYNQQGYCNSAEVTVIPQHAHESLARVSSSFESSF